MMTSAKFGVQDRIFSGGFHQPSVCAKSSRDCEALWLWWVRCKSAVKQYFVVGQYFLVYDSYDVYFQMQPGELQQSCHFCNVFSYFPMGLNVSSWAAFQRKLKVEWKVREGRDSKKSRGLKRKLAIISQKAEVYI